MDKLPLEVARHLAGTFLSDADRMRLSLTCRHLCHAARVDRPWVVLEHVVSASAAPAGFARSPNGYWYVSPPIFDTIAADALGRMAATDPWAFVRQWTCIPVGLKSIDYRRQCVNVFCMFSDQWAADVLVSLRLMMNCNHEPCPPSFCHRVLAATSTQLLRQAVWHARRDVVCVLLDEGGVHPDIDRGTALRLALCTIGHEHLESTVRPLVLDLLARGADPMRDGLWGIRLCILRQFYDVAACLCAHAVRLPEGRPMLHHLLAELEPDAAAVVASAMQRE